MGQNKATMLFRGEPLWKTQIKLLRQLRPKEILVSAHTDPGWRPADTEFVADQQPSRGPLSGITAALSRIATDHLLVLAIDVPFMTQVYLRSLCAGIQAGQGMVPINQNLAEPLVAVYPCDALVEFEYALAGDDFSLQPLIRKLIALGKLRPIDVSPGEASFFHNLNEPQDLADF